MRSNLFWKVSALFLVILLAFTAITLKIHIDASRNYALEVTQRMNHDLAAHTVEEIKPFLNGEVPEEKIGTLMHSMMAVNPGIEVYVLDTTGGILKYVALEGEVKMDRVAMAPINACLVEHDCTRLHLGDDPRSPGEQRIFSAAAVREGDRLRGYVYIILAGQEYAGAADTLFGSYFLKLSGRSVIIALLFTLLLGLLAIRYITRNMDRVVEGFRRFRGGDHGARIQLMGGGLREVADTFNDMAGTIEHQMKELRGVDELRKELVANVSHDLRTPIASIQGYAETLLMKEGSISAEERRAHLSTILSGSERLRTLVDDLFTLSKLESGQVKLDLEPISLGELVHDVVHKMSLMAQARNVAINVVLAQDLPIVQVDVKKIDRVLQNLIDNAIKFCRQGDRITIELDGKRPGEVELRITDTGVGIPPDELPHIFDRYFKSARSEASGGSGLGLAIVKRIVSLHGGEVAATSVPGRGTSFSFALRAA